MTWRQDLKLGNSVPRSIGHWSLEDASQHQDSVGIGEWASAKGADAVVWTALKPRFNDQLVTPTREEVVERLL